MKCCKNPDTVRHNDGTTRCLNCGAQTRTATQMATDRAERVSALIRARFGTEFGVTAVDDRISFDLVSLRRLIEALTATQSEGRDFERALAAAIKGR